jgi:hypothetical protein
MKQNHIKIENITTLTSGEQAKSCYIKIDPGPTGVFPNDRVSIQSLNPGEKFEIKLPDNWKLTVEESNTQVYTEGVDNA